MRIAVALFGTLAMFVLSIGVLFLGILGFTPVNPCTGPCHVPLALVLVGTGVIWLSTMFATWFRALREPRAYWPWIGALLIVVLYLVSLKIAEQVL
ncbi:hypothetical protein [Lentzea kentuckyensis]|uniref:hypothetical protein n=1 Tax=Lentzea kentuckyensis TaxID=360086 RepID=UPI000A35FEA0|nr:hypothetical protein [Lentzea kentuckyensis]